MDATALASSGESTTGVVGSTDGVDEGLISGSTTILSVPEPVGLCSQTGEATTTGSGVGITGAGSTGAGATGSDAFGAKGSSGKVGVTGAGSIFGGVKGSGVAVGSGIVIGAGSIVAFGAKGSSGKTGAVGTGSTTDAAPNVGSAMLAKDGGMEAAAASGFAHGLGTTAAGVVSGLG